MLWQKVVLPCGNMSGTRKVGETDIWKNSGYARTSPHDDDWILKEADDEEIGYDDDYIVSNPILIIRNGRRNHVPVPLPTEKEQSLV